MKYIAGIFIFSGYALISCIGLYWLKSATDWWSVRFISGLTVYVFSAGIWLVILKMYPLSIAFPIASGALMAGTTLVGYFLLNENITLPHFIGLILIFSGIAILALKGWS